MSNKILQDLVAYVVTCDSVQNAKAAIQDRLKKSGAKVVTRLTKEVSHIIFERKRSQKAVDKDPCSEQKIADLYRKIEGLPYPPFIVTPLWLEESISLKRRLVETKFRIAKPKENILTGGPSIASDGSKKKRRRRSPAPAPPKPADAYDLDPSDYVFSSTQQLNEGDETGAKKQAEPGKPGTRRRGVPRVKSRQAPETFAEERMSFFPGSETQAVADILAMDLPWEEKEDKEEDDDEGDDAPTAVPAAAAAEAHNGGEEVGDEIEGGRDDDDLDTPLGVRFARQSGGKSSLGGSVPRASTGGNTGGGSKPKPAVRRSRLAQASGPWPEEEDKPEIEEEVDVVPCTDEEGEPQKARDSCDGGVAGTRAPVTGVAERFSVRQLQRHPERPVVLHKGTPLPGVMPKSATRQKKNGGPIPIPFVARVDSPWSTKTHPSQEDLIQPDSTAHANKVNPSGLRSSLGAAGGGGGSLGPKRPRSSIGMTGEGSKTGTGTGTPWTHFKNINTHKALPSPWSAPRAWDWGAVKENMDVSQVTPNDDNAGGDLPGHEEAREEEEERMSEGREEQEDADRDAEMADESEEEEDDHSKENAPSNPGNGNVVQLPHQKAAQRRERRLPISVTRTLNNDSVQEDEDAACLPQQGWIAVTSVSVAITDLCKSAAQRLRGLRLCTFDRQEERQMTHLVIGEERRTLKALLAIANGAEMVSPEWVTASLEAGHWLPAADFPATVRFRAAAERARRSMVGPEGRKLLDGHSIHFYAAKRGEVAGGAALRRLATALGARAVPAGTCTMCIAVGETPKRPAGLSREIPTVSEEWLLQAAEQYKLPAARQFVVR